MLQSSVSQLTTKTPERGLLETSHRHRSHRLEETTSPGWKESQLGISGLRLKRDLPYLYPDWPVALIPSKLTHSLGVTLL